MHGSYGNASWNCMATMLLKKFQHVSPNCWCKMVIYHGTISQGVASSTNPRLPGGFNPFENICQIGSFPQVGMKKTYLKPPPRLGTFKMEGFQITLYPAMKKTHI